MSQESDPSTAPVRKYSRYRAVRQQAEVTIVEPPVTPAHEVHDGSVSRSMSRYRRSRAPTKTEYPTSPPVPSLPAISNLNTSQPRPGEGIRRVTDPVRGTQKQQLPTRNDTVAGSPQGRGRETENERLQRKTREMREREDNYQASRRAQGAQESHRGAQAQTLRDANSREELIRLEDAEKQRLLAEQKRKDLERLEAELDAAGPPPERVTSPGKEKFKIFSRKRSATKTTTHTSGSGNGSVKNSTSVSRTRSDGSPPRPSVEPRARVIEQGIGPRSSVEPRAQVIEQGGGEIVPGADAPMSAVNAGERRVLIRCKQSSINLPITPETTPIDLAYSAANIMSQNITPSSAVLIESYTQLGLERRIRRYEHIRDIMNSWDRDTQNALLLQNSDSPNHDHDLETYSVPRERPKDITVHMYHSQKPGKWNKRYITLLSTGQIFMSKKNGAKSTDKDALSLCHLSDFDIYTATPQQLRKTLKPPKKICYAIKSQQKTTMFLSTENYVHFFNTDDEALAEKWYNAVQRWRGWYLVNKMGQVKKATPKVTTELRGRLPSRAGPTHKVKVSLDNDPYTIGSFKPLMSLDRFASDSSLDHAPDYDSDDEENRPRQIPFHLRNSVSLSPLPSRRDRESKRHPPPVSYRLPPDADEEFASAGLLGRSYSQRQRALKESQAALKQSSGPFSEGPSLLNGSGETQRSETSAGGGGGLARSSSKREKPKPLLDFTPQFKEAPQWDKTGKGHGVPAPSGVPLVEVATGPEGGLGEVVPTVFRRDGGGVGARPVTSAGRPQTSSGRNGSMGREGAFIKGGLVSGK